MKCIGAEEGSHRRSWGLREVRRRLTRRRDWRSQAKEIVEARLPEGVECRARERGERPWKEWKGVEWDIEGEKEKELSEDRKKAVLKLEGEEEVDVVIYSDGSAKAGNRDGGAAAVVTRGNPNHPDRVEERKEAAGKVTSSFQAEVRAMRLAMDWLEEHQEEWGKAVVASDSQAGLTAVKRAGAGWLEEEVAKVVGAGRRLGEKGKRVRFVWVAGHCGLIGNEWADVAAKEASEMEQRGVGCMVKSVIRAGCRAREQQEWKHDRCRDVYGEGMDRDAEREWSREETVSMARFRSGHSLELAGYRKRIGVSEEGACRRCGEGDEDLEHVWGCVAGERKRWELGLISMSDLCCRPREALTYWRWWRRVRLKP